jgi:phage gp29-like protein
MAEKITKENMAELGLVGRDVLNKYGLSNENPDKIIARKGMVYLEELEQDTHLASQLSTRRQKLIKKGYRLKPAKDKSGNITPRAREIADFAAWNLKNMQGSFLKDVEAFLDSIGKGFSLTEINWGIIPKGQYTGKVGIKSLRKKPARWFSFKFDKYGHYEINQINPDPGGKELPKSKFIHLISGPDDENPYGDGVTAKCAFWVWLKKNESKFWAIYSERFGMPLTKVEMPANVGTKDEAKAEEIIKYIQTKAGIKVPKGFDVSFLEAVRSGDVNYDNFIERCNKEISKVVLGATLVSEEGKRGQGSYALGSSHAQLAEDYIIFDAAITAEAINEQLIKRLVDYNYDTDVYPEFEWIGVNVSSFISFAQAIGILVENGVNDIPLSWVHDQSGIPTAREGEAVLKSQQPVAAGSPLGLDNKSFAGIGEVKNFKELPPEVQEELKEMDNLHERYVKLSEKKHAALIAKFKSAALIAKFKSAVKKKVPLAQ